MAEYSKEEIKLIEDKWRDKWDKDQVFKTSEDTSRPKYYVLDMFPYPSGVGLHVGHPLGYIASDIIARYKRIKGFSVLHPMGFDAFGLPAEQYAIQTGQHPAITTAKNIETYKRQLRQIGFSFDWSREVQTSDPDYYKWTQWIFMQLFDSFYNKQTNKTEPIQNLIAELEKHGNKNIQAVCDEETPQVTAEEWNTADEKIREDILQKYRIAYLSETMVNWCPALGTVLSNDEVKDGVSERGGYPVERKKMWQWSMRISAYAERLLKGLDTIDWPEPLKEMQRNWIGKSIGCELEFNLMSDATGKNKEDKKIKVFTTRIDTIYGVTFMVIAPEHELVEKITTDAQRDEVSKYVEVAKNRSERERMSEVKKITGVFTGAYVINPFNQQQVPVWIADYVLAGYGTGAVMAVPSSDTRDYAFAKHFNLPVVAVLEGSQSDITKSNFDPKSGKMINSGFLDGLPWNEAIEKALLKAEALRIGVRKINYRMRDAIFGRQRYWGEPFPVYFKNGIPYLVDEADLPIMLPEVDAYKPTESGEPPLGRAKGWAYQERQGLGSEKISGPSKNKSYPFELTTMPGWAGSSWYWFRYMDPKNKVEFCSREKETYWKDVDLYIGGSEHATGHLLYSRFWCKAMKDLGLVEADEPFRKLINQGHIQGVSKFVYRINGTNIYVSKGWYDRLKDLDHHRDHNTLTQLGSEINIVLGKSNFGTGGALILFEERESNSSLNAGLSHISPLHVDVSLYDDSDGLDIEKLRQWRPDFQNAQFVLENGKYICGSEVEKMSKSKYNVVNPDDIIAKYGADTLRMYEMFLGPLEQSKPWNTNGIDGVYKFLRKFWNLSHDATGHFKVSSDELSREELKVLHKTLKKIEQDIENFSFNTSVSEMMICVNELSVLKCNKVRAIEPLVIALSPFAPHIAEELWEKLGHSETISKATFPQYDEQYLKENSFEYPISINGKVRAMMNFALDMPKDDIEKAVLASDVVNKWTEGKPPKKVIIVQGKIVNVVI